MRAVFPYSLLNTSQYTGATLNPKALNRKRLYGKALRRIAGCILNGKCLAGDWVAVMERKFKLPYCGDLGCRA